VGTVAYPAPEQLRVDGRLRYPQFGERSATISRATSRVLAVKLLPELALCDTSRSKNATGKACGERKETVTDKDLYRAILSVLQSHFDSTELLRPVSETELNDAAVMNNTGDANRAMQAHEIGQDAVNDWLSAKLTPERLELVGMTGVTD
jgi:hypothetical protein